MQFTIDNTQSYIHTDRNAAWPSNYCLQLAPLVSLRAGKKGEDSNKDVHCVQVDPNGPKREKEAAITLDEGDY